MPLEVTGGDPNARAKAAADLKYGAQQDAVQRAIAALAGQRQADEASINTYGQQGRAAIGQTFDQLVNNLETNRALVNRDLGIQVDSIGQGFRDANAIAEAARERALSNLDQLYGGNRAYSTMDIAKFRDPIESLAAQVLGENANADATFTGNLKNFAAQQDAIMQSGIGGAQRDRSNRLSSFENELIRAISEAKNLRSQQEYDYQSRLTDLIGERGNFQALTAADYIDQLFGQQVQAANYNLSERAQLAQEAYQRAQIAESQAERAQRASLARAEAQKADNSDYWRQLEYELKLKGLDAETARWLAEQEQQDYQNKMGISSFLSQGVGVDPLTGQAVDNSGAYRDILESMGLLKAPPRAGNVGTSAIGGGTPQAQNVSQARSNYGSKVQQKALPPAPLVSGNMATWTGVR